MTTATAPTSQLQADSTLVASAFCHLTREELAYLIRTEESLPQSVTVSDYWELYRNELEFE